jgi:hypothetical protein
LRHAKRRCSPSPARNTVSGSPRSTSPARTTRRPRGPTWRTFTTRPTLPGPASSSLHLDLRRSEDELFADLGRNNRYKINRAGKQDVAAVESVDHPTSADVDRFAAFFDHFAGAKGLRPASLPALRAMREAGALRLSRSRGHDGEDLCHHAHVAHDGRAVLLHSASHYRDAADSARRSMIGRANRHLHWMDIRRFKASGLAVYDFGGLALDPGNAELQAIDEFKLSFGGRRVTEYWGVETRTLKGWIALSWFRWRGRGD